MSKLYFIPGSQDLYGRECLDQVAADCRAMVDFLNEKLSGVVTVELLPTVETSPICVQDIRTAENDDDCVGVITWMQTTTVSASSPGCTPSHPQRCGSRAFRS